MNRPKYLVTLAALTATASALALSTLTTSADAATHSDASRGFRQTNLVSNIPGLAAHTDPNLRNPWGTSTGPGLPIWVSDNASGVSTLYDGAGNPQPGPKDQLVVTIPAPAAAGPTAIGSPTGTAFNPTPDRVPGSESRIISTQPLPLRHRGRHTSRLEPGR
jgi:hypothetical protein